MQLGTRKILDRAFSVQGFVSVAFLSAALLVLLVPIAIRGVQAFVFRGTIEYRRMMLEKFGRGDPAAVQAEVAEAVAARQPVYDAIAKFEDEIKSKSMSERLTYRKRLGELRDRLRALFGPAPGTDRPPLPRDQYGQTRWDRVYVKLAALLWLEKYDHSDATKMGKKYYVSRAAEHFAGTSLEPMFAHIEQNIGAMMRPRLTFYWRFLFDESKDAHFFGGIWPEVLGTFYLTIGAMIFAVPMGVIAAIYLVEYAGDSRLISALRACISTLAGVPSIVFGLFGLAFFVNSLRVSGWFARASSNGLAAAAASKSVLAGSLTLALLVLPIIIRSAEEAIRAVPQTYKEAALSLGARRWHTVLFVILPAALPGILTGIVISMGRAAGETAPIIFTAAYSVGRPLTPFQTLSEGTPALPWNIYNLCTEHQAADEIRHVQYGMVLTLVTLVLLLNAVALLLRARISRRLKG